MSAVDHDDYLDRLSEARAEEREESDRHRFGFEADLRCSNPECSEVLRSVLIDERTDEPWSEPEPCVECGSSWEFA